jgi:hypothetical protein
MATMLPDGRRLGAHLAMGDGLLKAADRAVEIGIDALQIFSDNPTAWHRRAAPNPEIEPFRDVLAEGDIRPLAIHGSYLINLAGWDDTLRDRSIDLLASELVAARRLGAPFVNIHTGSHRGTSFDAGVARLVDGVIRALDSSAATVDADADLERADAIEPAVVLENASGGGWALGVDLPQWTAIARAFDRAGVDGGADRLLLRHGPSLGRRARSVGPGRGRRPPVRVRRRDRAGPPGADAPERHEGRARQPTGSSRAHRRRPDRAAGPCPPPHASAPAIGDDDPRNAGDGRGLRRDQRRASSRARSRRAARAAAARGVPAARQPVARRPPRFVEPELDGAEPEPVAVRT